MNPLESFELINESDNDLNNSGKPPLIKFYIAEPSGKILYVNENKIFEIYKKYISLNNQTKQYSYLLPISLNVDKISFEKLALDIISKDEIYDIYDLYKLRDKVSKKSIDEESEIYVNMPICTHGKIIKKSFSKKLMLIEILEDNRKFELNIQIDNFSIEKEKMFIDRNEIFILGTIISLENTLSIDVGAILI